MCNEVCDISIRRDKFLVSDSRQLCMYRHSSSCTIIAIPRSRLLLENMPVSRTRLSTLENVSIWRSHHWEIFAYNLQQFFCRNLTLTACQLIR